VRQEKVAHEETVSAIVSTEGGVYEIGANQIPYPGNDELIRSTEEGNQESCFRKDLAGVLNKYSRENGSNTPDFILANYLVACLAAFDTASRSREEYYGEFFAPGQTSETEIKHG
jgi:hypothetical protein